MSGNAARLVRSDAFILGAVTEGGRRGQTLDQFAHDYDWLNRSLPTFDELAYGLERLAMAGYVEISRQPDGRLHLRAAPKATEIGKAVRSKSKTLGDAVTGFTEMLHTKPWPEEETEDRTFGPLMGFTPTEWDHAILAYHQWFAKTERRVKPILWLFRPVIWIIAKISRLFERD